MVPKQLEEHMLNNVLMDELQSAYRTKTETALSKFKVMYLQPSWLCLICLLRLIRLSMNYLSHVHATYLEFRIRRSPRLDLTYLIKYKEWTLKKLYRYSRAKLWWICSWADSVLYVHKTYVWHHSTLWLTASFICWWWYTALYCNWK